MPTESTIQLPLLSATEAEEGAREVDSFRADWLPHGSDPKHPYFYTLGAPIYIFGSDPERYKACASEMNPKFISRFGALYMKVLEGLSGLLERKFVLAGSAAVPGFHVYPLSMPNGGSIHFDLHQTMFAKLFPGQWRTEFLSFTLPLRLPASGGGLNLWPWYFGRDIHQTGPFSSSQAESFGKCDTLTYEVGTLYLINSLQLHQIAPNPHMREGEQRMTLQGHIIFDRNGVGQVYW